MGYTVNRNGTGALMKVDASFIVKHKIQIPSGDKMQLTSIICTEYQTEKFPVALNNRNSLPNKDTL